jgi:hypothetical protein
MNYRTATILPRLAVVSDYTEVIDLNLADPVSQFHFCYECTGVGSGTPTGHAAKCLSKIELVDGSDVLFSLSGPEAQALDFYHRGIEPANLNVYLNGMNCEQVFNVDFGRFLFDPRFAFDPRKFSNPQLKITIDRNAGGNASVAGFITVLAKIFDGKAVDPEGFLMTKEVKNYGMGSASHEYTDLPTDFPIRKLLIASLTAGVGPEYLIDTLKLSEDNDRKIPFEMTMIDVLRAIAGQQKPFRENVVFPAGAPSGNFYCTPAYWPRLLASSWQGENDPHTISVYGGDGGYGAFYVEATGGNWNVGVEGYAPHGAVEFPFGLQDDPDDWYDVAALGSLRLDILSKSGRSSSDTVQIFLQQLRKYAA